MTTQRKNISDQPLVVANGLKAKIEDKFNNLNLYITLTLVEIQNE